jgi:hypothetical protein
VRTILAFVAVALVAERGVAHALPTRWVMAGFEPGPGRRGVHLVFTGDSAGRRS